MEKRQVKIEEKKKRKEKARTPSGHNISVWPLYFPKIEKNKYVITGWIYKIKEKKNQYTERKNNDNKNSEQN